MYSLWELKLVEPRNGVWHLVNPQHAQRIWQDISFLWKSVFEIWSQLPSRLKEAKGSFPSFKETEPDPLKRRRHQRALRAYAEEDLSCFLSGLDSRVLSMVGIGPHAKIFLEHALQKNPHVTAFLYTETFEENSHSCLSHWAFPLSQDWPSHAVDLVLFPRILLHYDDQTVFHILSQAKKTRPKRVFIYDNVLPDNAPRFSLLNLNILLESGGRLRTLSDWSDLAGRADFTIQSIITHPQTYLTEISLT